MQAETNLEIEAILSDEVWQLLNAFGFNGIVLTKENRGQAAKIAIVHDTLLKRKGELDDIRYGMMDIRDTFGRHMISFLASYNEDAKSVFPR